MRILFTNNTLAARGGTECYILDVAPALRALGHDVAAFTLEPGGVADELRAAGIPVVDDPRLLPWTPDVIHGHHAIETTLVAMTARSSPVLSFCHGPEAWQEAPCRLPNVARWVAVDEACRERLIHEEGIPADRVALVLNFVDMRRFPARDPLPARPQRALVFSNYLSPGHPVMRAIAESCAERGIAVEGCGAGFGNPTTEPEKLLGSYDIVFAKARCALEAMAAGCAIIQADHFGVGRLVTSANFDEIRPWNFGYRSMRREASAAILGAELDAYDAADAGAVSLRVRSEASLDAALLQLEALYHEASTFVPPAYDPALEAADMLRFQLFLSKQPLEALRKTADLPLRLPRPGARGSQRELWNALRHGHETRDEKRVIRLEEKLETANEKIQDLQTRLKEARAAKPLKQGGWRRWFGRD
ncbi:MAG: glycosyltransferase [Verrucomicrobiales bacterium]